MDKNTGSKMATQVSLMLERLKVEDLESTTSMIGITNQLLHLAKQNVLDQSSFIEFAHLMLEKFIPVLKFEERHKKIETLLALSLQYTCDELRLKILMSLIEYKETLQYRESNGIDTSGVSKSAYMHYYQDLIKDAAHGYTFATKLGNKAEAYREAFQARLNDLEAQAFMHIIGGMYIQPVLAEACQESTEAINDVLAKALHLCRYLKQRGRENLITQLHAYMISIFNDSLDRAHQATVLFNASDLAIKGGINYNEDLR